MCRTDKTLDKMRDNPRECRIDQLEAFADAHGVAHRQPAPVTPSYSHPNGAKLTVPAHKPIEPEYVKRFVWLILQGTGD